MTVKSMVGTRLLLVASLCVFTGCGEKSSKGGYSGEAPGKTQSLFMSVAQEYQIPVRMMLAVAFVESDLVGLASTAKYRDKATALGIGSAQTAFGLTYETLKISNRQDRDNIEVQLRAYATLIRSQIEDLNLSLEPNPTTMEQKFDWIWQIAGVHRGGRDGLKRNIRVVLTYELIERHNQGYKWQDIESGEVIELPKEDPPIAIAELPVRIRDSLKLQTDDGEIPGVERFELTYRVPDNNSNNPRHIRVVHCPFSLSSCLEMQNQTDSNGAARLMAHYIIPDTGDVVTRPLQVASHSNAILITNSQGGVESVSDAVVIMLVGQSGRYVDSQRVKAKPNWFTKWQLRHMGLIIQKVCSLLESRFGVNRNECVDPNHSNGVAFVHQGPSEAYQWGDIADFDEDIFWPYIKGPETLDGKLTLELNGISNVFPAGTDIPLKIQFINETAKVSVERAERCSNGKLLWTTMFNRDLYNQTAIHTPITLLYNGPNNNGEHFLKITSKNTKGDLLGWVIQNLFITNPLAGEGPGPSATDCQRF